MKLASSVHILLQAIFLMYCGLGSAAQQEKQLDAGLVNPGFHEKPAWFKNSFLDLRDDIAEAATDGKRTILFFYQDGCPYCAKLLNENLSLRPTVEKLQLHFEVIALNIWGDREVTNLQGIGMSEKDFAAGLQVKYTPTLLILNETGDTVLRINGYYPPHLFEAALDYASSKLEKSESFRDYIAAHQPKAPSGKLHNSATYLPKPLDLRPAARNTGRPILALIEQQNCPACDELHLDIFQRPDVAESLKQYDIALIDAWSLENVITPDSRKLSARRWANELGITYTPSLIFFSPQGTEVFRAEAFLKAFHIHAALDYVASGTYLTQPNFQRYVQERADRLRQEGKEPDLMQ